MGQSLDLSKLQPAGVTEAITARMTADLRSYSAPDGNLDPSMVLRVDCSLCGAPCPEEALFLLEGFPYRRCPLCTLVYPSPRPRAEFIRRQYVSGRFTSVFREMYLPSAPYRMATIFRERVDELIRPRVPSGRLLDVGCGSGHFLKVAHDAGFEVHGVELNPEMVGFAARELGLPNIRCGTLEEAGYPGSHFDAVTLWDVLEHAEQPGRLLKEVLRVVRPAGWVFAYTENFDSFNLFVTGRRSEIVAPDVHIRHYSPPTFRREFEQAGFRVERVYTRGLDLAHIRKTARTYPDQFPGLEMWLPQELDEPLQEFVNRIGKGDNLRLFARRPEGAG